MDGNDRLDGGAGNDVLRGGNGSDVYVFSALAFGTDTISGFDANPDGGQDFIDLSALGITAANFASRVTVTDVGADLQIQIIGGGSMTLQGVGNPLTLTLADYVLAA